MRTPKVPTPFTDAVNPVHREVCERCAHHLDTKSMQTMRAATAQIRKQLARLDANYAEALDRGLTRLDQDAANAEANASRSKPATITCTTFTARGSHDGPSYLDTVRGQPCAACGQYLDDDCFEDETCVDCAATMVDHGTAPLCDPCRIAGYCAS